MPNVTKLGIQQFASLIQACEAQMTFIDNRLKAEGPDKIVLDATRVYLHEQLVNLQGNVRWLNENRTKLIN